MAIQKIFSVLFLQLVFAFLLVELTNAGGLQLGFYQRTCPDAELIVHQALYRYISRDRTLAASLLRMHFHDCFIRGCDASVLISSAGKNQTEKDAIPNKTLRGFNVIDVCKISTLGKEVSPVWFLVPMSWPWWLVTRFDVFPFRLVDLTGMFPRGRRDGRVSIANEALFNLPPPFANISVSETDNLSGVGLSVKDLAASIGRTHDWNRTTVLTISDPGFTISRGKGDTDHALDPRIRCSLKKKMQAPETPIRSPRWTRGSFKSFDEDYYTVVAKRRGLFQSDAALLDDAETRDYVKLQSRTQGSTFAQDFAESMVKMGNIGVLTGKQGEIRKRCAFVN
ncbi:PEROXIDASE 25-RELATED [Salix purpurea]|uniref:Peroxidase n=1 Tax=Salix purpurea TaxID=77065 RepID=A0A9Q0V2U6_SALPP|nr:PEROXIDASE 25-RELATED [Salix purpurea]